MRDCGRCKIYKICKLKIKDRIKKCPFVYPMQEDESKVKGENMANSSRAKLSKLRHDGHITDAEYQAFIKKMDGHDAEIRNKVIDEFAERLESEELQKYNLDMVFETSRDLSYSNCINAFCEYVDKIAEEMKGGWIPCSERLPEKFESVLVSCEGRIIDGSHEGEKIDFVADGYMFSKDHWKIQGHNDVKNVEVIAWKPLPAPYQPKGE